MRPPAIILGGNVQICDSAAAARVVMNEIASRRGRGETRPHPKVGHAALSTSTDYCQPQPAFDPILDGAIDVLLPEPRALRNFERMVTPFHNKQFGEGLELSDE